ncbi:MAG: ArsA family ATPase [Thermodesulfobacteriota bacterium]
MNSQDPRILVFSGKGGVGKTTVSASTALLCALRGYKTILISIDMAHSLSDAFDLVADLHDHNRGAPREVRENLWIQEVDIQEELDRHWGEVANYLAALLGSAGVSGVLAEELAIIPGMEDVVSLLYINQYFRNKQFDVIVIDCAPTGESLRFISMPSTLEWYIRKLFGFERNLMKVARPIARRLTDIPLPEDSYFQSLQNLFLQLDGVDKILLNPAVTSVRLVTNAERMVVRETQRAFMYFCLYGLVVDTIIVNRLFPVSVRDGYFADWIATQERSLEQIRRIFEPTPIRPLEILRDEVVGVEKLHEMGRMIYGEADPTEFFLRLPPYSISGSNGDYTLKIRLPFVSKDFVDLFKQDDELVVRIGSFKRHILLPRALAGRRPSRAGLEQDVLTVEFLSDPPTGDRL